MTMHSPHGLPLGYRQRQIYIDFVREGDQASGAEWLERQQNDDDDAMLRAHCARPKVKRKGTKNENR